LALADGFELGGVGVVNQSSYAQKNVEKPNTTLDTHSQLWLKLQRRIQRIPNRQIHRLLVQIVLQHDEPGLELRRLGQNVLECREGLGAVDGAAGDAPVCDGVG
jgi:hypothetical protein